MAKVFLIIGTFFVFLIGTHANPSFRLEDLLERNLQEERPDVTGCVGGTEFKVVEEDVDYNIASALCKVENYEIAQVSSQEQFEAIVEVAENRTVTSFFVGLKDRSSGGDVFHFKNASRFELADGSIPDYIRDTSENGPWQESEPNPGENFCLSLSTPGDINFFTFSGYAAKACLASGGYICSRACSTETDAPTKAPTVTVTDPETDPDPETTPDPENPITTTEEKESDMLLVIVGAGSGGAIVLSAAVVFGVYKRRNYLEQKREEERHILRAVESRESL